MALFSAVLKLFFDFAHFGGINTRTDFGDRGPIFTMFYDMIAQSSTQKSLCSFEKLHCFEMAAVKSGLGSKKRLKMTQNFAVFKLL